MVLMFSIFHNFFDELYLGLTLIFLWGYSVFRVLYIFWIQVAFQIFTASLCLFIPLIVSLAKWKLFWPHHPMYKILVSWPGIRPAPPALEAVSLNHWTSREVPEWVYFWWAFTLSICLIIEDVFVISKNDPRSLRFFLEVL